MDTTSGAAASDHHEAGHGELLAYTVEPHPVTGLYSGKLGLWLFLASEVMLFGALFSSYVLLRVGAPAAGPARWPTAEETHLSWVIGGINTLILIVSSVTMVMAWAKLKMGDFARGRMFLGATWLLAGAFIVIKLTLEYIPKFHHGLLPSTSTFFALYYTMTGLHGLHVIGGMIVIGYFLGPGASLWRKNPDYYTNRIECTGLYWHFVDLVWIFLFPVMYLMNPAGGGAH
ncbi:MAG: heme-copper oxidase subunit III [Planctomycetota bacterium]|nr:MAG: heme-copper oxidase subunit III [Planctomycetota bacterium]